MQDKTFAIRSWRWAMPLIVLTLLSACGGGGGSGGGSNTVASNDTSGGTDSSCTSTTVSAGSSGGPALTVLASAADQAFATLNSLRVLAGASALLRSCQIDAAATQHSRYTVYNNAPGHTETVGLPFFSGTDPFQRLDVSGFPVVCNSGSSFCGEVFSSGSNSDGNQAAASLFGAIYHRFVMLTAFATNAGAGAVSGSLSGVTYTTHFTIDLAASTLAQVTANTLYAYPYSGQTDAPRSFNSDFETPDPVPNTDLVGYPISIQAPNYCNVQILPTSFTLSQVLPGNTLVPVQSYFLGATAAPADANLIDLVDPPASQNYPNPPKTEMQQNLNAVALLPVAPLLTNTQYEVTVVGSVVVYNAPGCVIPASPTISQSFPLNRTWRFTTSSS